MIAFILLPFMVLIVLPTLSHLWLPAQFTQRFFSFTGQGLIAIIISLMGMVLLYTTNSLFVQFGKGTLAPWSPPEKLVIRGPYRYIRQLMISGVILVLAGEFLFLASWGALAWLLVFTVANMVYIPLFEEKALLKRFGGKYVRYQKNVRSWIPRLHAWDRED